VAHQQEPMVLIQHFQLLLPLVVVGQVGLIQIKMVYLVVQAVAVVNNLQFMEQVVQVLQIKVMQVAQQPLVLIEWLVAVVLVQSA